MKYTVDEITGDIVKLISVDNGDVKYESIGVLPENIKENDVVICENNIYKKDSNEELERINRIREKIEFLRNNNN